MTIKDIVFDFIRSSNGNVDFTELTKRVLYEKPGSKWDITHWRWYKSQIVSPNGRFHNLFSKQIIAALSGSRPASENMDKKQFNRRRNTNNELFIYPDLSKTVNRELAIILGKVVHHIHPDIANYIAKSNLAYRTKFESICHKLCNINSFFYEGSDCVFPGFRRPINREKKGKWKNNLLEDDGTILNDNTFPRHIWAFLVVNKPYSGGSVGMWASSSLDKFELAHIFAHKQDEREFETKAFVTFDDKQEPYGLFTSASNVVLIPKGFAKPTDHMESVKICFYKRHIELYGNNIIGLKSFKESLVPSWYKEIPWLEPMLPDDWKERIDNLLVYRDNYLARKYAKKYNS